MESATIPYLTRCVALLAEGVDRNREDTRYLTHYIVALLAEGVDRNSTNSESTNGRVQSPSSRRAWIEITLEASYLIIERVALLAEGVDRNLNELQRNPDIGSRPRILRGRAPRGGCGLLSGDLAAEIVSGDSSPSSRRVWIEISGST